MLLEELLDKALGKFRVPAIAVSIIDRDNDPVHVVRGTRVFGQDNPATIQDYFHIGSCSKSVLAVVAGRLVDAQKLGWNTKVFDIFPDLAGGANEDFRDITLTDLFRGEAGILRFDSDEDAFPTIDPASENPRLEFVEFLLEQPPASARQRNGKFKALHSNASFTIVAAMLERITGNRWEDLVERAMTEDLGIEIHLGWPNKSGNDQPWGHILRKTETEVFPPDHPYKLHDLIAPAGDLSMTPEGFARYIEFHRDGLRGTGTYLDHSSFQQIHFAHKGLGLGFGNGSISGHRFSATNGSAGTFFCQALILPESDFALTIMMNAGSGTAKMPVVDWLTMKILKQRFGWRWKFWM